MIVMLINQSKTLLAFSIAFASNRRIELIDLWAARYLLLILKLMGGLTVSKAPVFEGGVSGFLSAVLVLKAK